MTVQDDVRERELCRVFGLIWDQAHSRGGEDAWLRLEIDRFVYRLSVEVKSTTGKTVSTARDVGMEHITRWRSKVFVFGFYDSQDKRPELQRLLCLSPLDMEPWISSIEAKVEPDYKIAERASHHLTLHDLHDVCGEKQAYTIEDAKRLHKAQWTNAQYHAAIDMTVGGRGMLSPATMLSLLKLRAQYIAERGATLNNPHITSEHLKQFWGTDREARIDNAAATIRKLMTDFVAANPGHPAVSIFEP